MGAVRVLITTTSFQDNAGEHHQMLADAGYELVTARGPLSERQMLELVGDVDGMICGDDAITAAVLAKALPRLKVVSKYGIGLDRIDLAAATRLRIPVTYTPGVNHVTVAEHTIGLMIALLRRIPQHVAAVRAGGWQRQTGVELAGKSLGIVGLGRIGREVALRARAFGMGLLAYDIRPDADFAAGHQIRLVENIEQLLRESDIVSLHVSLSDATRRLLSAERLGMMREGAYLVNTARAGLIDGAALVEALRSGRMAGYATDVLEVEPPPPTEPLLGMDNVIITPHIGSRTFESVARQAKMAVENLLAVLEGRPALAVANPF